MKRKVDDLQKYGDRVYDRVFERGQFIWWGCLNDVMEWDLDSVQCFAEKFTKNCELIKNIKTGTDAAQMIIDYGVDLELCLNAIDRQTRLNLIPKDTKPRGANAMFVAWQASTDGIREALYFGIYTLINDFHLALWNVQNCIDAFRDYATAYNNKKQNVDKLLTDFFTREVGEVIDVTNNLIKNYGG